MTAPSLRRHAFKTSRLADVEGARSRVRKCIFRQRLAARTLSLFAQMTDRVDRELRGMVTGLKRRGGSARWRDQATGWNGRLPGPPPSVLIGAT